MDDGKWSGEEPRCELAATDAQDGAGLGTGIAIGAAIIIILLVVIGLVVLHRNKARPVKNTENVQAAERKEDQNAAVMSYSSLEHNRRDLDNLYQNQATFNTFHPPNLNSANNRSTGKHLTSHLDSFRILFYLFFFVFQKIFTIKYQVNRIMMHRMRCERMMKCMNQNHHHLHQLHLAALLL